MAKTPAGGVQATLGILACLPLPCRASYNRETGGNLKPSAPNPKTEKDAARRKSFCARSAGQMKMWPKAANDPNSRLRKARRAWKC